MSLPRSIPALGVATLVLLATTTGPPAQAVAAWKHVPCAQEDAVGCTWDARHLGNGTGRSYLVSPRGRVTPVSHARAHRLLFG